MKVLLASEFGLGQIGGSFQRAFEEIGVEVDAFDMAKEYLERPLAGNRYFSFVFRWRYARAMSLRLYQRALQYRPDLLLVTKGHWINPRALRSIHSLGAKIFNFYTDSPFFYSDRSYGRVNTSRWVYESFALYDAFFTFTQYLMEDLRRYGCRRVEYLPFARDPHLHRPYEGNEDLKEYECDISFIGNLDEERLHWLTPLSAYHLKIWGGKQGQLDLRASPLRSKFQGKTLYGEDFAKAIRASKITLNLMRQVNLGSHNMRTFEAPSCRAFVLSVRNPEVVQLFREDKEAAYFSTRDELLAKVELYLAHPEERERIARAGWERVKDETYAKRAQRILEVYQEIASSERR